MINLTVKDIWEELKGAFYVSLYFFVPIFFVLGITFLLAHVIDTGYPIFGAVGFVSFLFLLLTSCIILDKSEKESERLKWKEFDEIYDELEGNKRV